MDYIDLLHEIYFNSNLFELENDHISIHACFDDCSINVDDISIVYYDPIIKVDKRCHLPIMDVISKI
jgi:hypothetical protein